MLTTTLHNPSIQQKQTTTLKTYYLIKENPNSDDAYFAFEWIVKEGWKELVSNWEQIKELEVEYFESEGYKKITSLYIPQEGEVFL